MMQKKMKPSNLGAKKISEIIQELERQAPSSTAEEWDNVGLLLGDPNWKTPGAVISVDLTAEALALAKKNKFRLIINHHPCIFPRTKGISRLTRGAPESLSSLMLEALRSGIAVAAYHTNFDQCALEVVDEVSKGLGLKPLGRLVEHPQGSLLKLAVFVPESHLEVVRLAVCEAGAGHIGNYDYCTFGTAGVGSFRGSSETNPFFGKPNQLEKASEIRLETIFPRGLQKQVLQALFKAHPYEEMAFDLYPVEQGPAVSGVVKGLGYGFWGEFSQLKPFSDVSKGVKRLFKSEGFWLTDPPGGRSIKRVAFVAGKGSSFLEAALQAKCDLFITGEAGYHVALNGARKGMAVLELGHTESERFFVSTVSSWLKKMKVQSSPLWTKSQKLK